MASFERDKLRSYISGLDRAKLRRWLPTLFIVLGVALLGYVGSEYWTMYRSQQQLEADWEQENQQQRSQGLATQTSRVDDGVVRLTVPKIELSAFVVEGTGNKQLRLGPGRLTKSAKPGEKGNSVITAHRDTFFRHIYELESGDEIMVQRAGRQFKYQVTGKKIVKPHDTWVLKQTGDAQLTLITCYPTYYIGPAPERLVVFSKMVEDAAAPQGSVAAAVPEKAAAASAAGH